MRINQKETGGREQGGLPGKGIKLIEYRKLFENTEKAASGFPRKNRAYIQLMDDGLKQKLRNQLEIIENQRIEKKEAKQAAVDTPPEKSGGQNTGGTAPDGVPDIWEDADENEYRNDLAPPPETPEAIASECAEEPAAPSGDGETISSETDDEGNETVTMNGNGESGAHLSTQDNPEEEAAYEFKADAKETIQGKKTEKLNKNSILLVIVVFFVVFVGFSTFILPNIQKKEKKETGKPQLQSVTSTDYESLAKRRPLQTGNNYDSMTDEQIMDELPPIPVNEKYTYIPAAQKQEEPFITQSTPQSASAAGYARPDTREDKIQSKTISGIKGISPTQNYYLQPIPASSNENAGVQESSNPYARYGLPSKEDYTRQMLDAYGQQNDAPVNSGNSYANQNDQSGKTQFYNNNREQAGEGAWLAANSVWQGTILEATLTSGINTDLPGDCTAMVTKNVYSSLDGRFLLIPQNSKLFGTYNSSVSYSQKRVQVAWHTLIRPDGYAVNLGNMVAADPQGAAGLKGLINGHPFQYLNAIALMSVFNIVSSELQAAAATSANQYVQNVAADTRSVATALGSKLIDRAMDVQPTITIKSGIKINVVTNNTFSVPPLQPYEVLSPYQR